ncbi:S41 family peptidase [uncultured Sunxiuqinia sp.]|uniref:S41 family peptidase n=1 Tax=uncultured Sunxiuqinia sp. TaxID=1573825 RepID=UPI002628B20B|nr:S41 family peptidase [uncultured Sunxiuqinia sp.]
MRIVKIKRLLSVFLVVALLLGLSCTKENAILEIEPVEKLTTENSKTFIYDIFQDWYFWLDQLPELDPNSFSSNESLIDALVYKELDRWSFVTDLDAYRALFEEAQTKGFGVGMALTADNRLMVRFTYKNSPMGLAGVERGWEFLKINDVPIANISNLGAAFDTDAPITFTFATPDNRTVSHTMSRTDYKINTVLHRSIQETAGKKVGYLVFESFLSPSEEELKEAFTFFNAEGIDELVVDLRYNGGGDSGIAFLLQELIGGSAVEDKLLGKVIYNEKHSDDNFNFGTRGNDLSVDVDRLFFITTDASASASEMVINGMFPYKEVIIIGSRTYGKPVGMNIFESEEYNMALAPVTLKILNANNEGDYFNGIPVNYEVADDIFHGWGNPAEACLKTALDIIAGNEIIALKSTQTQPQGLPLKRGLQEITGAY